MFGRKIAAVLLLLLFLPQAFCAAEGEKKVKVTLTFTGDVTLGSEERNMNNPDSFHGYASREGYGWFFRNMKEMFSADDLTLVNLEGVLSDRGWGEDKSKTFRFRGPADYARILKESGIEACAVSNNHIMDYGKRGYEDTKAALTAQGILYCGNQDYFILGKDGIKIAFFALGNMYFTRYRDFVKNTIAKLRTEDGVNAVVCSFHAGQEYVPRRRSRDQEKYARIAVEDWGADLVVMHHPHVLQGIDRLNGRYVFYSLGNFCFGGNMTIRSQENNARVRTLETAVIQVELCFSGNGTYLGQSGRIYPCFISSSAETVNDPNDFQPKFVTGEEAGGVMARIQEDTTFELGVPDEGKGYVSLPYLAAPEGKKE